MRGKSKILRKLTAALLLNVFSFNILADGLQVDPNSRYNTSLDRSQNGVPIVNISTPNGRGVSINEFLEYNVGREGQVLNNADNTLVEAILPVLLTQILILGQIRPQILSCFKSMEQTVLKSRDISRLSADRK